MARILVIDNYDSFVYNVVSYLAQLGAEVEVWRNDDARFDDPAWLEPFDGVLLSPGPGTPQGAGVCVRVVTEVAGRRPLFGICLGLQAIAVAHGATVGRAGELCHGKTSPVTHDGRGVFEGVPNPVTATRYHSLAVDATTLPDELQVSSATDSGIVMGLRHTALPIEGVQFHPESVLTEHGHLMLANWLAECGDPAAVTRAAHVRSVAPAASVS